MNQLFRFENLPCEIFIEIFGYLHAIDLFTGFGSLNRQISSILRLIHLHVVITSRHHLRHVQLLSHYLGTHADQVVSLAINIDTEDGHLDIDFLFQRHRFYNARSCVLKISCLFSKLLNFIQQLESLTNLQSISITQPDSLAFECNEHDSICSILSRLRSTTVRSVTLLYHYDHCGILSANNMMMSTLEYLELILHISSENEPIYSLIHQLRFCSVLQHLRLIVRNETLVERDDAIVPPPRALGVAGALLLNHLTRFDFYAVEIEDISFLDRILQCMANLVQFSFTFVLIGETLINVIDVLDGQFWEELLSRRAPSLLKFDFYISVAHIWRDRVDLNEIIDSFEYFLTRFDGWHMAASRWLCCVWSDEYETHMRTLSYPNKLRYNADLIHTDIVCGTFEMRSTLENTDFHHTFYSHYKNVQVVLSTYANRPDFFTIPILPFRCVTYLIVSFENRVFTWLWNKLMKLIFNGVWIGQRGHNDPEKYVLSLSRLFDLSTITKIQLEHSNNSTFARTIEFLLLSCPNLSHLIISASFLFSEKFVKNSSLMSLFSRLIKLELLKHDDSYFLVEYAPELVQHFSSLIEVILTVYSFDCCGKIIDILLTGLPKLVYIKINFHRNSLFDNPITSQYIIENYRKILGVTRKNIDHVLVTNDEKSLLISFE